MNAQKFLDENTLHITNLYKLSPGEEFVLQKMGQGLSTQQIALIKGNQRSVKTIEKYMEMLKKKLQIPSTQILRYFAISLKCYCDFTGQVPVIVTTHTATFGKATAMREAKKILLDL